MKKFISSVLALAFFFGAYPAHAGYAQLKPPPGWSQGLTAVQGQAGTFAFGPASNSSSFKGGTVLTNAALNVAGQFVTVPVSMRVAANAATVAAEWSFGNPYLFAAALAAPLAYNWFRNSGLRSENGAWVRHEATTCSATNCTEYSVCMSTVFGGSFCSGWTGTLQAAASAAASKGGAESSLYSYSAACSSGSCAFSYSGPNGESGATRGSISSRNVPLTESQPSPVSLPEFLSVAKSSPMPDEVLKELPQIAFPIEKPVFNPDPAIEPSPSSPAVPRPLWVPTGNPVKNPNPAPETQPDTWTQPGVRVTPSPTDSDPWRVDVTTENKTKNNPAPNSEEAKTSTPSPSEELITCGLPGKPKCLVDETGTPEPLQEDVYKPKLDDYKTKQDELKQKVSGQSDKTFFSGWSSVFVTPPLAACTGYVLPRDMGTIDPCPVVDGVRTIMAYIWALTALFLAVGMVKRVV